MTAPLHRQFLTQNRKRSKKQDFDGFESATPIRTGSFGSDRIFFSDGKGSDGRFDTENRTTASIGTRSKSSRSAKKRWCGCDAASDLTSTQQPRRASVRMLANQRVKGSMRRLHTILIFLCAVVPCRAIQERLAFVVAHRKRAQTFGHSLERSSTFDTITNKQTTIYHGTRRVSRRQFKDNHHLHNLDTVTAQQSLGKQCSTPTSNDGQRDQTTTVSNKSKGNHKEGQFCCEDRNKKLDLTILLLDNHDSYTYNIYSYLGTMCRTPPIVIANDAYLSWDDLISDVGVVDCIVISPGPGWPGGGWDDIGVCLEAIEANPNLPILGVCLGHQALAHVYGGTVGEAPCGPAHGMVSKVWYTVDDSASNGIAHEADSFSPDEVNDIARDVLIKANGVKGTNMLMCDDESLKNGCANGKQKSKDAVATTNVDEGSPNGQPELIRAKCNLFASIPQNFDVIRYHSLCVSFPPDEALEIEPVAWCSPIIDGAPYPPGLSSLTGSSNCSEQNREEGAVVMALQHKSNPHFGVQFHPESIGTGREGYQILRNFCDFVDLYRREQSDNLHIDHNQRSMHYFVGKNALKALSGKAGMMGKLPLSKVKHSGSTTGDTEGDSCRRPKQRSSKYQVLVHKVALAPGFAAAMVPTPEKVYDALYRSQESSYWLDSSTGSIPTPPSSSSGGDHFRQSLSLRGDRSSDCPIVANSRFSILGGTDGPLSRRIEYYGPEHQPSRRGLRVTGKGPVPGVVEGNGNGNVSFEGDDMLSYLRQSLVEDGTIQTVGIVMFDDCEVENSYSIAQVNEMPSDGPSPQNIRDTTNLLPPFEYRGGYVGYLGYEVRHDVSHSTPLRAHSVEANPNVPTAAFLFADRSLVFDHWTMEWYTVGVALNTTPSNEHHPSGSSDLSATTEGVVGWMKRISGVLRSLAGESPADRKEPDDTVSPSSESANLPPPLNPEAVEFVANRPKSKYEADIRRCHEAIRKGESYELCLTNQLEATIAFPAAESFFDPLKGCGRVNEQEQTILSRMPYGLYKILRRRNPAPFAAFLHFDGSQTNVDKSDSLASFSVCCSSPERFLSVMKTTPDHGRDDVTAAAVSVWDTDIQMRHRYIVETKPIKGTCARPIILASDDNGRQPVAAIDEVEDVLRAAELQSCAKNRAENLMIVDLLRNDLSRVCEIGSVQVSKLMDIESYATVHQMVSTIRGFLPEAGDGNGKDGSSDMSTNLIDVISACFPGGSMTGAPKIRTMDILDQMEEGVPRGPYSGCLGYLSLNGCMDMNIVIRTAVVTPGSDIITETASGVENDPKEAEPHTPGKLEWKVSIGAGGAITALSKCDDEYEEMMLKARAVKEAVQEWMKTAS